MDIHDKLADLHKRENELNKQISNLDKIIRISKQQKLKFAKQVSANMRYRNILINRLKPSL